jgi:hypothetical protein
MSHYPPRYRGWKRPQQPDTTGVRTIAGQPLPAPEVTEALPRSTADRIRGGNDVRPRKQRQPSLARVMRELEPSPLKRAFG